MNWKHECRIYTVTIEESGRAFGERHLVKIKSTTY